MRADAPVGVFDSGVGGLSVLRALRARLPREVFVYFSDAGHAPYGERGDAFVAERARAVTRQLVDDHGIKALVVACNTATAAAVEALRAAHPHLVIVGVEPALKPAVQATRTGHVLVLATRGTLGSAKFLSLLAATGSTAKMTLQPCDGLAAAIESADEPETLRLLRRYTVEAHRFGRARGEIDTIVLGCTHYPFAADALQGLVGAEVRLLDTGEPVARQTALRLAADGIERVAGGGPVRWLTSGAAEPLRAAAWRWLGEAEPRVEVCR